MKNDLALYVDEDGLRELTRQAQRPEASAHDLLALAWHLRERNAIECARWADTAQARYAQTGSHDALFEAHMALLRAAQAWGDDPQAFQALCSDALARYESLGDLPGQTDALMLSARGWFSLGDVERAVDVLRQAASLARVCGATDRYELFDAIGQVMAASAPKADDAVLVERLRERIEHKLRQPRGAPAAAYLCNARSTRLNHLGRTGEAADAVRQASALFERVGLVEQALIVNANEAMYLYLTGDAAAALALAERALARAEALGFRRPAGSLRARLGYLCDELGYSAQASAHLHQALTLLQPQSFSAMLARLYLADAECEQGHGQCALDLAREVEQAAIGFGNSLVQRASLGLQARAVSQLGRADEALALAKRGWTLAQSLQSKLAMFEALLVLARLHHAHPLADPDVPAAAVAAPRGAMLHYLRQAREVLPSRLPVSSVARVLGAMGIASGDLDP
jgi:tetratricopeptide (TPR) repeat protein